LRGVQCIAVCGVRRIQQRICRNFHRFGNLAYFDSQIQRCGARFLHRNCLCFRCVESIVAHFHRVRTNGQVKDLVKAVSMRLCHLRIVRPAIDDGDGCAGNRCARRVLDCAVEGAQRLLGKGRKFDCDSCLNQQADLSDTPPRESNHGLLVDCFCHSGLSLHDCGLPAACSTILRLSWIARKIVWLKRRDLNSLHEGGPIPK
jgi:hypothetical protein